MNLIDFEEKLRKAHGFNRQLNYFTCFVMIAGVFIFLKIAPGSSTGYILKFLFAGILLFMSVYGIISIRNKFRPEVWVNSLSAKENVLLISRMVKAYGSVPTTLEPEYQRFVYRKNWLSFSYSVHLFADEGMIAVKADSTRGGDGIVDFGASRRMERQLLRAAEKLARMEFPGRV